MKAVSVKVVATAPDGKRIVDAFIVADETPAELPETGENVDGLSTDDRFAPMSILYIVGEADSKLYLTNENGIFVPQ